MVIRDACADDTAALRDVFRRASLSNEGDREVLLAHPEALVWERPHGEVRIKVAIDSGRVLGFATTSADEDGWELEDLFVDPDHRRHGVARGLIADAVAAAREAGIERISVIGNPDALAFYRAVGFVIDGEAETEFGTAPHLTLGLGD